MQREARWSRALGAVAGAAVAVFGAVALVSLWHDLGIPPLGLSPTSILGLVTAGLALLLTATAVSPGLRWTTVAPAALTVALGVLGLVDAATRLPVTERINGLLSGESFNGLPPRDLAHDVPPAASLAVLLVGLALLLVDRSVRFGVHPTGPLLVGVIVIAVVALAPSLFALGVTPDRGPGTVMSPYAATALLALAGGTLLARPERRPLAGVGTGTPGAAVTRRIGATLLALPFVAALFSAIAAAGGMRRPTAAISTGTVVAALALVVVLAQLVRSLDEADRRQRRLMTELRERREFADTLLQQMNAAVMVLDADRRVVEVNQHWQALTGQPADAAIGQLPPYPWEPEPDDGDLVIRRPDGTSVPVLASTAPVTGPGDTALGFVATYVDIGGRKRAERALAAHAAAVETKNRELEAALAFKSDLTSILTHDVSQPISSVASIAELVVEAWDDMTDAERLQLLRKIHTNGQKLVAMMTELSLLFRLDTGSVTARRAPVGVRDAAEATVEAVCPGLAEVDVDPQLAVLADREQVRHVLTALLKNAVTHGGAPVRVEGRREGDHVVIVVADEGRGVPAERVPALFDRFTRGSGMGLFIVRHLVEANGGAVRYEAAVPRGARLVVTLEAATTAAAPAPEKAAAPAG
ncbi:PAS domain-containing sensor histidine kinase [Spirilliplanes yamanashiensis]|uniref:Sensor-like histidine kinase SenX3 n=1 Tax=Spirilliplanes yamanashiensis TaxID=42233 RepID=A0A8J3Y394_9ACTN|nr:ATP-binding protein [Spirilliplanes yamanashiensis]MDP9814355.1 signal transduction histidine kinase [Spirilliplanes yamanashiensis]GIJ00662.1 hypothetical protein Sya03_00140 [Spirilliplanes yamanashiensis]